MAKMVFVLFQILIPILLLNMLIAMMGNTYAIVISTADKEFLKQVMDRMHLYFRQVGIIFFYCRNKLRQVTSLHDSSWNEDEYLNNFMTDSQRHGMFYIAIKLTLSWKEGKHWFAICRWTFSFQWAKVIMSIERSIPSSKCKEHIESYSIGVHFRCNVLHVIVLYIFSPARAIWEGRHGHQIKRQDTSKSTKGRVIQLEENWENCGEISEEERN